MMFAVDGVREFYATRAQIRDPSIISDVAISVLIFNISSKKCVFAFVCYC